MKKTLICLIAAAFLSGCNSVATTSVSNNTKISSAAASYVGKWANAN